MATEDEIVIELDDGKNGNMMFPPTQTIYRGSFKRENLPAGATSASGLLAMPTLPGFLISLSFSERRGRILDPLGFESNKQLFDKWGSFLSGGAAGMQKLSPEPPKVVENMTDNQLATWHYHMRRLCQANHASLKRGAFREKVKGTARVDFFDSNPFGPKTEEEMEQYRNGNFKGPMRFAAEAQADRK